MKLTDLFRSSDGHLICISPRHDRSNYGIRVQIRFMDGTKEKYKIVNPTSFFYNTNNTKKAPEGKESIHEDEFSDILLICLHIASCKAKTFVGWGGGGASYKKKKEKEAAIT